MKSRNGAKLAACPPIGRTIDAMPRPHRLQVAGGLYHVTTRGNRRKAIYHDDEDRRLGAQLFDEGKHPFQHGVGREPTDG